MLVSLPVVPGLYSQYNRIFILKKKFNWGIFLRSVGIALCLILLGLIITCIVINYKTGFNASAETETKSLPTGTVSYSSTKQYLLPLDGMTAHIQGPDSMVLYGGEWASYVEYFYVSDDMPIFALTLHTNNKSWSTWEIPYGDYSSLYSERSTSFTPVSKANVLYPLNTFTSLPQPTIGVSIRWIPNTDWVNAANSNTQLVIGSTAISAIYVTAPSRLLLKVSVTLNDAGNNYIEMGVMTWNLPIEISNEGAPVINYVYVPGLGQLSTSTTTEVGYTLLNPPIEASIAQQQGYSAGYVAGTSDGFDNGYSTGYNAGFGDGSSLGAGAGGVIGSSNAIIRVIFKMMNVPILGEAFTLGTLLAIVVILGIVIFIVRLIRG